MNKNTRALFQYAIQFFFSREKNNVEVILSPMSTYWLLFQNLNFEKRFELANLQETYL
ncbi:hypothetical protein BvCmsHHP019_01235 [Escherichia coli]|nr:hypothetical protein BvCmsHHP019_01235 [Escherichia coli]